MRDVLDDLMAAWRAGRTAGLATVVHAFKSAPRLPGAAMLVDDDGVVSGSVSGGCVEGDVYENAREVIASGRPLLQRYGLDRKSTRLNSSHVAISYAVFCLK